MELINRGSLSIERSYLERELIAEELLVVRVQWCRKSFHSEGAVKRKSWFWCCASFSRFFVCWKNWETDCVFFIGDLEEIFLWETEKLKRFYLALSPFCWCDDQQLFFISDLCVEHNLSSWEILVTVGKKVFGIKFR